MNAEEISILAKIAFADWPRVEVTQELITNWALVLGNEDFKVARLALQSVLKESGREYAPRANEVLAEIERGRKCATVPRITGPILETYTQEHTIGGKKVTFGYIRTTAEARAAYKANAEAQGRKYTEAHASKGTQWDADCKIPPEQMHHLFEQLYKLMDDYEAANDEEARAACDKRRDALKQFYFDVAREA